MFLHLQQAFVRFSPKCPNRCRYWWVPMIWCAQLCGRVCVEQQQRVTVLAQTELPGTETHLDWSVDAEGAWGSGSSRPTPWKAHKFYPVIRAPLWAEPSGRPSCLFVPPGKTDRNQSLAPKPLPHGALCRLTFACKGARVCVRACVCSSKSSGAV